MIKIGLLSDSHGFLDPSLIPVLEDCDEIWHAGAIGSIELLDQFRKLNKPLKLVYGNIDGHDIRIDVPENLVWMVEGMKVLMTHIGGYPGHYTARVKKLLLDEKPDIFVCGHSHILKVIYDKQLNLLHINPGSCGKEGFHKVRTMVRFGIENGKARNLAIIELGKR
jgi:uncharacterized protein